MIELTREIHFWQTWWFWVLTSIILFFTVFIFIRSRIERSRRNQVRLEVKIAERTREIRLQKTKIEEQNVQGGETAMLHLDDWEHCEDLFNDPIGKQNFVWGSPKSKNIEYKVEHPVFTTDDNGKPNISYIDQFPEPKNMDQGIFLQKLSDALEESKNKVITKLVPGSTIVANNYFWLHGRKPFKENKDLSRELLRIRGSFFIN